jgi:MraZ protein
MIVGEYTTKIGPKKRTAIPKKFREELGDELILTRGYENALIIVNKEMWKGIAGEVIGGSFINRNIRDTSRFLVGSAVELDPDSQGRIVIPESLYKHAKFDKEIVFVGLVNWIELWDKGEWEARLNYINENSDKIAEELTNAAKNDGK